MPKRLWKTSWAFRFFVLYVITSCHSRLSVRGIVDKSKILSDDEKVWLKRLRNV